MHSKRIQLGLAACASFLLALSAEAISPPAEPTPQPTPLPVPTVVPAHNVNSDESLPVVIDYGQGETTRVSIYRGMMEPVGVLPNQAVTVTISFPTSMAGAPVKLGLYDGGAAGPAALPGSEMINGRILPVTNTEMLQFNFQAGRTLGLYRVLMTVGSGQYLLGFYAGKPTGLSTLGPTPTPVPTPNFVPKD